jgi:hypothetical protein
VGRGAGTSGCSEKNREGGALERGLSVTMWGVRRMQGWGMSCGTGVLLGFWAANRGAHRKGVREAGLIRRADLALTHGGSTVLLCAAV